MVSAGAAHFGVERIEVMCRDGGSSSGERFEQSPNVGEWCGVERVVPLASAGSGVDEAGMAEHPQVPTDGGTRNGVIGSEIDDSSWSVSKAHEQLPPNRVSESVKNIHDKEQ